ncbi:hypothetical protein [Streptomyces chartreusis]|uniref:hypothetical protein n=1 Tax=Streptomyces chartreusis TaxID=1969 RepID=UPI0037B9DCE0
MEVTALVLSAFSTVASLASYFVAANANRFSKDTQREAKRQEDLLNKRDLFLSLHERLCGSEQLHGRRLLRHRANTQRGAYRLRNGDDDDALTAGGAVAMLDTLGLYVERGYVYQDLALEESGDTLIELKPHARRFIEARDVNRREPWPHYQRLAEAAVEWARRRGQHPL